MHPLVVPGVPPSSELARGLSVAVLCFCLKTKQNKGDIIILYGCTLFRGIPARGGGVHAHLGIKSSPERWL